MIFNVKTSNMKKAINSLAMLTMALSVIAQIPEYVPTDSLKAWWSFSENALDASVNGINGTVNGASLTSDRHGAVDSAYQFDGVNNWIDLGDNPLLNPGTSDLTISAWIKTTSSEGARIFSKGSHGGEQPGYDIMIYPGAGGKAALIYCPGTGGFSEKQLLSDQPVNDGLWHLITGVITRSSTMKLYVDGILQSSQINISSSSSSNIGASTYNATIGASYCYIGTPNLLNEFFNGKIDQIGVWKRSLNHCEIWALYFETFSGSTISPVICDTFPSPSGNYKWISNGIYSDTLTNVQGCDSIITVNLTVLKSTSSSITVAECESYTAPDGTIYTESGIKTAVIPNAAGCDSTITIDLTIKKSTSASITESACDSYTAPDGTEYTTSGIKTAVIPNAAGCDSTITIDLTIKNSTSASITESACDSYTAPDGTEYITSGIKTAMIPNAAGCDSTITIDLTISMIDVSVVVNESTITSNAAGANYQWVNCDNGFAIIMSETSQSYTATANGNYAVIVTQGPCSDTSSCVQITADGFASMQTESIFIYPNPMSDQLIIEIKGSTRNTSFEIFNSMGQVVTKGNLVEKIIVQTDYFLPGVYLIKLENGQTFEFKKIIKN
jgi:hypothetical protein